jgi:hypothetical protein|tara:strand:+ start:3401 stop:3730 length:330 start_codon:yes stop_codon:yes gene_type:complete
MSLSLLTPLRTAEIKAIGTLASPWQSGSLIRRTIDSRTLRRWSLEWTSASSAQAEELEAFHDSQKGAANTFTWTPPGESATTVRIVENTLHIDGHHNHHQMKLQLEEAF